MADKYDTLKEEYNVGQNIRIPLSSFTVRTDISYGTILGLAGIVAVGMYF